MGTCESREDSLSVSAKKGIQEPSSPQNKEDLKSDESVIKLKRSNYDPSDFVQYYDHIKKLLKEKRYKFSNPGDKATFQMRLATSNGLDKETARVWIHMYVDYMILVAWWKEHAKRTRIIYPPYAIQQVARLHAVFTKSYLRFCRIITEGRRLIKLAPIKVIAQQDTAVTYEALKNGYYSGMHFIWQRIYSNGNLGKSDEVRKQAEEIWEPFDQTLFKSEFNFSFCDPEQAKEFANKLADNQKDIALKSKNNKDILDVGKTLRGILEIGDLMKGSEQVKPTLMDQFKIATDKLDADAVSMVEEASFTGEFVNLLAWENRISIETAKKWILEYKKFLFLSYIHRQRYPIIPSEIVDQVWHLHLQFVHTYQQDVHKKQEFHHNPWKAGEEDMHKQRALYKETLYLYNQNFGTPDAEIWPDDNIKFHELASTRNYGMFFARKLVVIDEKYKSLAMTRSVKFYKSSSTPSTMLSSGMSLSMSSPMTPAGTSEIALLFLDQS